MDLSTQAKEHFARFGCSLELTENCFYVDIRDIDNERLSKTGILIRAAYAQWVSTPLFCLAFEVSPSRALARYCYFPFDLSNLAETAFLMQISEVGELNITLVGAEGRRSGLIFRQPGSKNKAVIADKSSFIQGVVVGLYLHRCFTGTIP